MNKLFGSFIKFVRTSKRAILLITITAVITLIISSIISIWLSKVTNWKVPSFGKIKTLGVEAYWDPGLKNKTETFDWGVIWVGTSKNVTLYLQSISNFETTLYFNTTNWSPTDIMNYTSLSWNYNGTMIHPGEIIEVTLTFSAPSSYSFFLYLIANDVKQFSFDIIINSNEYGY